jgi:hypothetical protein
MKKQLKFLLLLFPKKFQIWVNFRIRVGYYPNFRLPKSFNEKIQHRKLYDKNPLYIICSDKLAVREYVKDKIGEKYLIPLLYLGDKISKADLKKFDCDYVVKTTHNSGGICIVKQAQSIDYSEIETSINKSLQTDFGVLTDEPWYSSIIPRVIVERMLKDESGNSPPDYKFHVFNCKGDQKLILQVDYDRNGDHNRTFYDESFNILPFSLKYKNLYKQINKVSQLKSMVEVAKKLSSDFDYVRVDLYWNDCEIFFGELTFAAESGFGRFNEKFYDFYVGSMWK